MEGITLHARRIIGGGRQQACHRRSERLVAEPRGSACRHGRGSLERSGTAGGARLGTCGRGARVPASALPPPAKALGTRRTGTHARGLRRGVRRRSPRRGGPYYGGAPPPPPVSCPACS